MTTFNALVRCTPPQRDVLLAARNPATKLVLAIAGIRGGKTHIGALATILRAIEQPTEPDQCHAVVSPTFPMSKIGPEAKLFKLLDDRKLFPQSPLVDFHKSERCFYVRNVAGGRSKVRIFSGERPHRWRGDAWLSAWLDEAARLTEEGWDVAQGRLADNDGPALFTTTPDGMNFCYDLAQEATRPLERVGYVARASRDRGTVLVTWGSQANAFLKSQRGFDRLQKRYDADTYAQEVLAQFIARTGRVYKSFDRKRHVKTFTKGLTRDGLRTTILVGQDFNVGRMCSVFLQEVHIKNGTERGLHAFAELELRDADTYRLVRELNAWCQARRIPPRLLTIVPDASSRKRQTAGSDTARSDLEILERAGLRVRAWKANPRVKDRVNAVNGLFYNDRAFVDPTCTLLVEALEKQKWDENGEPEKDGVLDNRVDALGYAVWYRWPLRGVGAQQVAPSSDRRAA